MAKQNIYIYLIREEGDPVYVGQSKRGHLDSYMGRGSNILKAVSEKGKGCFTKEILKVTKNPVVADKLERNYIKKYKTKEEGYNVQKGGGASNRDQRGDKNGFYGKKHTLEAKAKMDKSRDLSKARAVAIEKSSRAVECLDNEGEVVAEYKSGREAQRQTGLNQSNIVKACKRPELSCGGFKWRYKDGD